MVLHNEPCLAYLSCRLPTQSNHTFTVHPGCRNIFRRHSNGTRLKQGGAKDSRDAKGSEIEARLSAGRWLLAAVSAMARVTPRWRLALHPRS